MANEYSGSIAQVATDYAAMYRSQKKSQLDLDTESFLQLIVAQIQNQDVLGMGDSGSGSSSSGDYVNQLLQMTLVQSISDMMDMSMTSYAMSMVGKEVVVAEINGTEVKAVQGVVSGVSIYGDEPILHIDGKDYKLSQVMTVGSTEAKESKTEALLEEILKELRKDEEEEEGGADGDAGVSGKGGGTEGGNTDPGDTTVSGEGSDAGNTDAGDTV